MIAPRLGSFLVQADYWMLWGLAIATFVGMWAARSSWLGLLRRIPKRSYLLLALILLVSAVLRLDPGRWEHNVFDDEYVHGEVAHNLAFFRLPVISADLQHQVGRSLYPVWPPGYHFWFGTVLRLIGGYSERVAFGFNAVVGMLCVPAAFVLAYALFSTSLAALAAAAFVATWPLHVKLSNGASTEVLADLFLMLFAIAMILHARERNSTTQHLLCQFAAWTALIRPELFVVAPVTVVTIAVLRRRDFIRQPSSVIAAALVCLPLLLPVAHAAFSVGDYNAQRAAIAHSCLVPATLYWLRPGLYNPLWTILAIGGVGVLWRRGLRSPATALLAAWGGYILVVSVYRRVDPNLGDLQRYFVLGGTAPLLLASGFLGALWERSRLVAAGILGVTLLLSVRLLPQATAPLSPMAPARRIQAQWLQMQRPVVPRNAIVFSDAPSFLWSATGWDCRSLEALDACVADVVAHRQHRPLVLYKGFNLPPGEGAQSMQRTGPPRMQSMAHVETPPFRLATPLIEATLMGQSVGLFPIECDTTP